MATNDIQKTEDSVVELTQYNILEVYNHLMELISDYYIYGAHNKRSGINMGYILNGSNPSQSVTNAIQSLTEPNQSFFSASKSGGDTIICISKFKEILQRNEERPLADIY